MKSLLKATIYSLFLTSMAGAVVAQEKSIDVIATIPEQLVISDIDPLKLDLKDKDINDGVNFKVYANSQKLNLIINGDNGTDSKDGSFLLTKGGDSIKFKLKYVVGSNNSFEVLSGQKVSFENTDYNHRIALEVKHSDWKHKPAGKYNETLRFTLSQE